MKVSNKLIHYRKILPKGVDNLRISPMVSLVLVGILSAGGGATVGYALGHREQNAYTKTAQAPVYYSAHAGMVSSVSPPALREALPILYEPYENDSRPLYVLGTDHGFVAVFYVNDDLGNVNRSLALKERTRMPADALPFDERERLLNGIYVYTEEQLVMLLQDYGS